MQNERQGQADLSWGTAAGWVTLLWALASGFSKTLTSPVEGLDNRFVISGIAIVGLLVASSLAASLWNVMKLRPALPIRRQAVLTIASVMVGLLLLSEIRPASATPPPDVSAAYTPGPVDTNDPHQVYCAAVAGIAAATAAGRDRGLTKEQVLQSAMTSEITRKPAQLRADTLEIADFVFGPGATQSRDVIVRFIHREWCLASPQR